MDEDAIEGEFFQWLFRTIKDVLSPVSAIFSDNEAKAELFGSLGLRENTNVGSLPSTSNLDNYVAAQAGEADAVMLASAMADLVLFTLAIEGAVRAAIDADDMETGGEAHAVDEIFNALINVLLMDYIRRRNPQFHAAAALMATINAKTVELGGNVGFFKSIGDFFAEFGNGFETTTSTRSISYTSFSLLGILLIIFKGFIPQRHREKLDLRFDLGYEDYESSTTPIADEATDRAMSMSLGVTPFDDPDNQGTFYTSFVFVPEEHDGIAFLTDLSGEFDSTLPISDDITLKFDVSGEGLFRIGEGAEADFGRNNKIVATFKHKPTGLGKLKVFPLPEIRIGVKKYALKVSVTPDDFDLHFDGEFPLLITREADAGFPLSFLPERKEVKIPLKFGFSLERSFYFGNSNIGTPAVNTGESDAVPAAAPADDEEDSEIVKAVAAALLNLVDLNLPLNADIGGVVGLQNLVLKFKADSGLDQIDFETSLDFWIKLGPLTISISRLGAELEMSERDDNGGILGYDLAPQFKPPTGAGIVIDAGAVKGGGFLYFDPDNDEYFGAIELQIKGFLTLKAIGLIETKLDTGEEGLSVLFLVTAEFTPISLAFGFTLDGVGGLLGLNRTVEVEALRIGLRTNAIKSVMFPEDVVANINRIISDIKDIFPVRKDQFVIGLMAQIGYGGSDLVKIELGVILEVPDPKVIILGVVKVVVPTEDTDVLRLQVNFLGLLDFQNEFAYFEAHLFDSHVVGFPLTGSLAMVVGWGNNGLFALSVGGFHPDFKDYPTVPTLPGAFRDMARIGFSLLSGDNPTLTIECYFAVTSNSFQFGAKLELLASGPMGFNLYGLLALDALFIFDPFSFTVGLEATLAIRKGTSVLFGISFKGLLQGPEPWHVEGEVTFGLLFFDVTIGFSHTWGNNPEEIATVSADLVGIVRQELQDARNWQSNLIQQHHAVTHRPIEQIDEDIVIYPFGELRFSQRTIPLNQKIEKYGEQRPLNEDTIRISDVNIGTQEQATGKRSELFASGNFLDLSEQEKLSRKSFENYESGFDLKDSGKLGTAEPDLPPVELDYELNYTADDQPDVFIVGITLPLFAQAARVAAVAQSEYSWANSQQRVLNAVEQVQVQDETYTLASMTDMQEVSSDFRAATLAEAEAFRATLVANDPSKANSVQVVMAYEVAG